MVEGKHNRRFIGNRKPRVENYKQRLNSYGKSIAHFENDLINANMNLERMTELVEAQRWISCLNGYQN